MRDKIYIIILSVIFAGVMIWCPVLAILSNIGIVEIPENKNIKLPSKVYEESEFLAPLLNSIEQGKANLENIYSNNLPFYEGITKLMLDNERFTRETLLNTLYDIEDNVTMANTSSATPDVSKESEPAVTKPSQTTTNTGSAQVAETTLQTEPAITEPAASYTETTADDVAEIIPVETQGQYKAKLISNEPWNKTWAFAPADLPYSEGWTDRTVNATEEELRRRMDIQLGHVNRIAAANTDVNFYVYVCTRFQETEIFGEIIKDIRVMNGEFSTKSLMDDFLGRLDMSYVDAYDYFKIDTVEKRLERVFKTDHHESPKGAYSIYTDIVNMIGTNAPEIGEVHTLTGYNYFDGIELCGSHVWAGKYSEIVDEFYDYIVDLPVKNIYTDLNDNNTGGRKLSAYTEGNYSKKLFADHYADYYPRPAHIEYPTNNTGRNLLILGDSYTWAAGELIASNFDDTYITLWTHGTFEYNKFITAHNITDVMIMQVSDRLLYDIQNDTQLGRVVTDN